jgi:DNA-binding NarL/FixJ family response regulator
MFGLMNKTSTGGIDVSRDAIMGSQHGSKSLGTRDQRTRDFLQRNEHARRMGSTSDKRTPAGRSSMSPLRILVADDHEVVRHGVRALLERHHGWDVCSEAVDGRDAVDKALQQKPDVVILDIGMPNLNGLDAAREILRAEPRIMILILTIDESEQVMREVLNAGARGFLLKSDTGRDLIAAVEALQSHRTFFTSKVAEIVLDGYLKRGDPAVVTEVSQGRLTRREREVVQLLAEGKTTKEVAAVLGMSVKTAETHRSNIMRKLNFHSVSQLVLYAVRNNIVQVPPSAAAPSS